MSDDIPRPGIPRGWRLLKLEDVCSKITDGTHKTPEYQDAGVRFISIKNIRPFQPVNWDSYEKYISQKEHEGLTRRCKPEFDDILFPRIGTLGFAKRIDFKEEVSIFVGLGLLKPLRQIIRPKFLELWMNTPFIDTLSRDRANGSGRLTLPLEESRRFPVPVAPLDEQDRIVAEVEKQFTRLDAGVAALRRVQANLKRYRAAVLKAACEGRLVPTDLSTWQNASLRDVLVGIESGKSFRCEERPPREQETGVMKVSAVTWGEYDELESKTCLDPERIEERYLVVPGDFLFSRANTIELIGACVIARRVSLRVMLSDKILRFHFHPDTNPKWVLYWLRSEFGRHEIERLSTGNQESMRNIGQERIRQIAIKLPAPAEQKRIVAEVERRLSVIDELESVVTANLARATRLRQSILQWAFTKQREG